jgi:hypothetical protein
MIKELLKTNYTFVGLAQAYFPYSTPQSAAKQLKSWMKGNKYLMQRLAELCYDPHQRLITPLQCDAIIGYLGIPCSFDME